MITRPESGARSGDHAQVTVTKRDTLTTVDCPTSLAINETGTCTVTVDDVDGGTASAPTGSVSFSLDPSSVSGAAGTFSNPGTSCTLVADDSDSASCTVDYTPTATAGSHVVKGTYAGTATHAPSSDTDTVTVTKRDTLTTVDCEEPRVVNEASLCTVTVTDADAGGRSDPEGDVDFVRSVDGDGNFSATSCTLASDGVTGTFTSSCQVTYTPISGAGTHTVTGTYDETSSTLHATSQGSDDITVSLRQTTTSLSCIPPVQQVGSNITCTATVSDVDPAGMKSDPEGTVTFQRDGAAAGSCTLQSDGNSSTYTSSCYITYTSATPAVDEVKATYAGSSVHASSSSDSVFIVFYDPNAGFVTGGGWINSPLGAYTLNPTLAGKANFGFVSKYQKGATVPSGNTEFQFHVANFNFKSTSYEWLVIAGAKAQYKGSGKVNGLGDYGFILTATDGQVSGGGGVDKFRIKIWDKVTGTVVYDNQPGATDDAEPSTALGGGSIVIHKK